MNPTSVIKLCLAHCYTNYTTQPFIFSFYDLTANIFHSIRNLFLKLLWLWNMFPSRQHNDLIRIRSSSFYGCDGNCLLINHSFHQLQFSNEYFHQAIGHVSGGHINPAVTIGMLVAGKVSLVRAILYIIVQCCGAIAGTAALKSVTPEAFHQSLGHTDLQNGVIPAQGLGIEFFLGFVLVFTVFGVCDENKPDSKFVAPLAIGLTVTLGHLGAVSFTGASMNPARTFGTAVIRSSWDNHWVCERI